MGFGDDYARLQVVEWRGGEESEYGNVSAELEKKYEVKLNSGDLTTMELMVGVRGSIVRVDIGYIYPYSKYDGLQDIIFHTSTEAGPGGLSMDTIAKDIGRNPYVGLPETLIREFITSIENYINKNA